MSVASPEGSTIWDTGMMHTLKEVSHPFVCLGAGIGVAYLGIAGLSAIGPIYPPMLLEPLPVTGLPMEPGVLPIP